MNKKVNKQQNKPLCRQMKNKHDNKNNQNYSKSKHKNKLDMKFKEMKIFFLIKEMESNLSKVNCQKLTKTKISRKMYKKSSKLLKKKNRMG